MPKTENWKAHQQWKDNQTVIYSHKYYAAIKNKEWTTDTYTYIDESQTLHWMKKTQKIPFTWICSDNSGCPYGNRWKHSMGDLYWYI